MFYAENVNREKVVCPVCKAILTYRSNEDRIWVHCDECRCTFYFAPLNPIPTRAQLDSQVHKGCGCGRCGA